MFHQALVYLHLGFYANAFASRSPTLDTVFFFIYGGNTAGDGRVEIFRYDRVGQQLDFNTVINNTGFGVIGNLIDTTVSDGKTQI